MSAIILPDHFDPWLDRELLDSDSISAMAALAFDGLLAAYLLSQRVSAVSQEAANYVDGARG